MAKPRTGGQTAQRLGMREGVALPRAASTPLNRLAKFDLWFVEERLRDKSLLPAEEVTPAVLEFRRFIALQLLGHRRFPVPSRAVDVVWHTFLLFTKEYHQFCDKLGVGFIHHVPTTSRSRPRPGPKVPYEVVYAKYFPPPAADTSAAPPGMTVESADRQTGGDQREGSRRRYDPYADGNCEGCTRS